ncbi:TIGR02466 family protein [Aliiglaciecola litoralis]|uniref:Fe2OG dioxygenase domain-containing protein n=1 Tax=Aliiglaciecola litoralis TaxID=582857 RepID=A0ABN1LDP5_9ALTE
MTIQNFDVQPLFAIPYFRANLSHAISKEQIEYIKSFKMLPNQQNMISENLSIFEDPKLASIKKAVQEALDIYAKEVMGIEQKLYVTQSWSLINNPNIGMHTHSHSNSIVSGSLYYAELPAPVSRMVFDKHTTYRQLVINPSNDKQNIYNTPINVVTPQTHDILLFPSELTHQVEPNLSDKPRYSIAFNCFVKGKLGDLRDVSQLTL